MRILIVSYLYAPDISPRAFRWTAISEYWAKHGHKVDVVSAWKPGFLKEEVLKGVHVYRVGGAITELLRSRLHKSDLHFNIEDNQATKPASFSLMQKSAFLAKWIHDQTWKKVYWPDYACLWYFPAWEKAKQLLKLYNYDALISVSHPFTGHLVGLSLKKYYPKIQWIVDNGDPFCFLEHRPTNNYQLYKKMNYASEREILRCADIITVTTESTLETYASLFPESANKIYVIPPLISLPCNDVVNGLIFPRNQKIRLLFVGTLYRTIRNPNFLLQIFGELLQTYLADKLELHFFGSIHDCQECFAPYQRWLDNKIFLHGIVDRSKVFQAMREADVLVNIGNVTPFELPSKLVEYVSIGKPILNIVRSENDSSVEFLEAYPGSMNLMDNASTLVEVQLNEVLQFLEHPPHIENQKLQNWLATFQIEKIADTYKRCLASKACVK